MNENEKQQFREYVLSTARARGIDPYDNDEMHDLADELMWGWLDLELERDAEDAIATDPGNPRGYFWRMTRPRRRERK